jgi:DNA-binding beta-propeller fold protein YncE
MRGFVAKVISTFNSPRTATYPQKPGYATIELSKLGSSGATMKANLLPAGCFLSLFLALSVSAGSQTPAPTENDTAAPQTAAQAPDNAQPNAAPQPESAQTESRQTEAAPPTYIQIANWTQPESGWLYVVDPRPGDDTGGRIWLVDPASSKDGVAKVMGSVITGDKPDFALSPDGSRLYVASLTEGEQSEFAVIDTAAGTVVQRATIDGRVIYDELPPFSTMGISADGSVVRILTDAPKSDDKDAFVLASFDTRTGEFLRRNIHVGNCGPGRFITNPAAHPDEDHFDFLCPRTNRVRMIRVAADASELQNTDVKLPWERREGVALAIEPSGSDAIAIVRGDGGIFQMSTSSQEVTDTLAHPELPNRIPPAAWPVSPDGNRLYLGYKSNFFRGYDNRFYLEYGRSPNIRSAEANADEFRIFDTQTWKKLGKIKTKTPFWSAAINHDGTKLYAMVPQKHSILIVDTEKKHQIGVLKVGGAPALAVVAP